jgi:hypothetical protein
MSNKVIEALKKLLPEENINEVAQTVEGMLSEAKQELETEMNKKLEEAYSELANELTNAEKVAVEGYEQAYAIITDLRHRLVTQKAELEKEMYSGFEEAYQMIETVKKEKSALEVDTYDEYDKKLQEMKEYIVDRVDAFLQEKGAEIYEQAKRDVLNDPRMAEHKVALDKIVDITATYLSDEDMHLATSSKLEEASKHIEHLGAQIKLMEARSIRLDNENRKLNEAVRKNAEVINENKTVEKKEKVQKAKNVSGRGHIVTEETVVIAEHNNKDAGANNKADDTSVLVEGLDLETLNTLAGTKKAN